MVELQQYPGFDPMNLNPLPHSLETETVLDRVVSAQVDLARKVRINVSDFFLLFCSTCSIGLNINYSSTYIGLFVILL